MRMSMVSTPLPLLVVVGVTPVGEVPELSMPPGAVVLAPRPSGLSTAGLRAVLAGPPPPPGPLPLRVAS